MSELMNSDLNSDMWILLFFNVETKPPNIKSEKDQNKIYRNEWRLQILQSTTHAINLDLFCVFSVVIFHYYKIRETGFYIMN